MTVLEQFKSLLSKVESEELKTELTEAFGKVEGVVTEFKETRDKAKEANTSLSALKKDIAELMGFSDDYSKADIEEFLKAKNSNKDLEALKADLTSKYENDLKTLRDEIAQRDSALQETTNKYNDSLFKSAIVESGLLSDFVDEPMARANITSMIKDSLIYEDGKVYVKDATTGEKAKDIRTGEFLSPKSVIDNLKTTISPIYLNPDMKAQGGGTPPASQGTPQSGLHRSKMSHAEKGNFIAENGNDAYLQLPN